MNKYTLYLPLFFALFALAGCEKEHTGYLFTENARYPIDSLKIIRYEDYNQEVIRLEEQLNSYSGEILDSLNAYRTIEAEEEKIIEELDRLEGIMNKHGEKLNAYLDQFADESDADPDRVQELTDNCEKAYEAWVTYELEVYQPVYQIRDRIERKIKALCQEAGLETPFTIARELEKLQKQQALDIPDHLVYRAVVGNGTDYLYLGSIRSDRGEAGSSRFRPLPLRYRRRTDVCGCQSQLSGREIHGFSAGQQRRL